MTTTIEELYTLYLQAGSVTTDSRNCPPNALFFALKGERFDGNQFALSALQSGCSYAVVDNPQVAQEDARCILVNDVLRALTDLARYHRRKLAIPILGITGTNGKTTTKELIATVLRGRYSLGATVGNLNNQIGVPLTLLSLHHKHQIAVVEMGASHIGDINELTDIAKPNYALITNIGRAHLEGFGSYEGVIQAKSELYDYIRTHEGKVFVHSDDELLMKCASGLDTCTYGTGANALLRGELITHPEGCFLAFSFYWEGKRYEVNSHLVGNYNLPNALAAVSVGLFFGVAAEEIVALIEGYIPSNNRSQFIAATPWDNDLIVDAYNANPSSMATAIHNFVQVPSQRAKVMLLGDMYELGKASSDEHLAVIRLVEEHPEIERICLVGANFYAFRTETNAPNISFFPDRDALMEQLRTDPIRHSLILMKASNSMRFELLVALC